MNVWSYWKCPSCLQIVRGDCKTCPHCSTKIPASVKYLMPDNPEVIAAVNAGTVLTADSKVVKKVQETVPDELVSTKANWKCEYCGTQNSADETVCSSCCSPRSEAKEDYFGKPLSGSESADKSADKNADKPARTSRSWLDETHDRMREIEGDAEDLRKSSANTLKLIDRMQYEYEKRYKAIPKPKYLQRFLCFLENNLKEILCGTGVFVAVAALITLIVLAVVPVEMHAYLSHKDWSRSIAVETYTQCFENDWNLPSNAILLEEKQEKHHDNKILDHYDTKVRHLSKQVQDGYETRYRTRTREVLDGYETHYRDLGNGQAEVYETPVYRTETYEEEYQEPVYKTVYYDEEYEEPVYRYEPVYKTKYYYEIGRWKQTGNLTTAGTDDEPYWHETDIPNSVPQPQYGDKKLAGFVETYTAFYTDEKGETQKFSVSYDEYESLTPESEKVYKANRFTGKPQ